MYRILVKRSLIEVANLDYRVFYEITDKSWENLTTNISEFVNDPAHGDGQGVATKNAPTILRPDWNAVKDQLKLPTPLESIPCK